MVNIEDFIKRLEIILDYYNLSASALADKIGVQRSSLSHLLSGRNKPSLDLILKIVEQFPAIDLYWITTGKGNFPKVEEIKKNENLWKDQNTIQNKPLENTSDLFSGLDDKVSSPTPTPQKNSVFENKENIFSNTPVIPPTKKDDEIERIVVFFKNGTFKNYTN